ncbi:MAG: asparagine synthase-related protein [Roseibacillus sp.]
MIRILPKSQEAGSSSAVVDMFAKLPNYWSREDHFDSIMVEQFRFDKREEWDKAESACGRWHLWIEGRPFLDGAPRKGKHVVAELLTAIIDSGSLAETLLRCDGGATAFFFDREKELLEVATDLIGLYPAFVFNNGQSGLSTHSEWLAEAYSGSLTFDELSLVEQIYHSSVSPPYTFYNEMRELSPALHQVWSVSNGLKELSSEVYWTPRVGSDLSYEDSVKLLAEGLEESVVLRTKDSGKKTILLSGGADSRLILGANQEPEQTSAITLVDAPNPESEISKKLAQIGQVQHEVIIREKDHYSKTASLALDIAGGFGSPMDNHILSLLEDPRIKDADTILTGCHGDYFFKSVFLPKKSVKVLGRSMPIKTLAKEPFLMPNHIPEISVELREMLQERWEKRLYTWQSLAPEGELNALEASRVMPMSREIDSLFRTPMARILPWDPLFYSRKLLDLMWRIPVPYKVDGVYYEKAVKEVVGGELSKVKNANYGSPLGASAALKTGYYLLLLVRKYLVKKEGLSSSSWPNYKTLLQSDSFLRSVFENTANVDNNLQVVQELGQAVCNNSTRLSIDVTYNALGVYIWLNENNTKNKKYS